MDIELWDSKQFSSALKVIVAPTTAGPLSVMFTEQLSNTEAPGKKYSNNYKSVYTYTNTLYYYFATRILIIVFSGKLF